MVFQEKLIISGGDRPSFYPDSKAFFGATSYRTQWSKSEKVFQRGDCPNFGHFPLETYVLMSKYQKLAKSVGGN